MFDIFFGFYFEENKPILLYFFYTGKPVMGLELKPFPFYDLIGFLQLNFFLFFILVVVSLLVLILIIVTESFGDCLIRYSNVYF